MLITKRAIDLTPEETERCRELTYGDEGWMQEDFDAAVLRESEYKHYRYTQVILYTNRYGTIQGWCLLQPVPFTSRYVAYFFVDPDCRGRGIGSQLMTEASKWGKFKMDVLIDETNEGFFSRFRQLHEGYR